MLILEENLILSNVLIREPSNFDDWKCPTQQSIIWKKVTSYKIGILGNGVSHKSNMTLLLMSLS